MMRKKMLSRYSLIIFPLIIILTVSIVNSDCYQIKRAVLDENKTLILKTPYFEYSEIKTSTNLEYFFNTPIWTNEIIGSAISSPTIGDLDGDGFMEIVILSDHDLVYIMDCEGKFLEYWGDPYPKTIEERLMSISGFAPYPLLIDMNDDGQLEIVCATFAGTIHAWFLDGTEVPGWPLELNGSTISSPAAGDIDGDSREEIVIGCWDSKLYAFEMNGSLVKGFPFPVGGEILGTPALGNLDDDPELEIVFGSYDNFVYALNGNGSLLSGWPKETNHYVRSSAAIADLDNDGENEIIIGSWDSYLYIFRNNGSSFGDWPWKSLSSITNSPIIDDLNRDNFLDIVIQPSNITIYAFTDSRSSTSPKWNQTYTEAIYQDVITADINGDQYPEVICVSRLGKVRVISYNGSVLLTKEVSLRGLDSSPVIGDIDGDNFVEIIFATSGMEEAPTIAEVLAYKLGAFGLLPWPSYRGGQERIGMPSDKDRDGLSDLEEKMLGTSSNNSDTDGDLITDGDEIYKFVLDPTTGDANADYDSDGLTNVEEVETHKTDPTNPDSDGDNLTDGQEVNSFGTDPLNKDTDEDFLPDDFEVAYDNTDPLAIDTYADLDEDNLDNIEEYEHNTNPDLPDTDGDSLLDGDEVKKYLTNPLIEDADLDADEDGLSNVDEIDLYGTSPIDRDTDGDGYTDKEEVDRGSDPTDAKSRPFPLWALAPIIGGGGIIITIAGYFIIRKVYRKRRGEV